MKIGVTGHQKRPGIDWNWVSSKIGAELSKLPAPVEGLTSLAEGADQVFADEVLRRGGRLKAIIPVPRYTSYFSADGRARYEFLKSKAEVEELEPEETDEASFFKAGKYIADQSMLLFAVWDGRPAEGLGGTADVVKYALQSGKTVIHFDPISKKVQELSAWSPETKTRRLP